MRRKLLAVFLIMGLCVATAYARFGSGIVYDRTNYANAVLRYLRETLSATKNITYVTVVVSYRF